MSETNMAVKSTLSKLLSLNGLCAIYKKQGPTSAHVLNEFKETLLKGKENTWRLYGINFAAQCSVKLIVNCFYLMIFRSRCKKR